MEMTVQKTEPNASRASGQTASDFFSEVLDDMEFGHLTQHPSMAIAYFYGSQKGLPVPLFFEGNKQVKLLFPEECKGINKRAARVMHD